MKAYVLTTGAVFALLVIAHVVRVMQEGMHLFRAPDFLIATILAAGASVWAAVLFRRLGRASRQS